MSCRAAVLTAAGRGAIAVIRVWGDSSLACVESLFRPHARRSRVGLPRLGRMGGGQGDEVVLITDPEGNWVEIQGHGGPAAIDSVLGELAANGVSTVPAAVWLGDRSSALVGEAVEDLANAETDRAAEILLDQSDGALDWRVVDWLKRLSHPVGRNAMVEMSRDVDAVAARAEFGRRLVAGGTVLLAGPPNAGKSSLFNAIVGFDRSIVDAAPGTTRDVVSRRVALAGWPLTLLDTAGLRETDDLLEAEGVSRTRQWGRKADLVVVVSDRSRPPSDGDRALRREFPDGLVVASKADLPSAWSAEWEEAMPVSAHSGENLEVLTSRIVERLFADPPAPGEAVPTRKRQADQLVAVSRWLSQGDRNAAIEALEGLRWGLADSQRVESGSGGSGT